jgi:hypothetical protein
MLAGPVKGKDGNPARPLRLAEGKRAIIIAINSC